MRRVFLSLFFCSSIVAFSQPTQSTISNSNLTDVWMVDASVGYAGGIGGVYKTTNGGSSWTQLSQFVDSGPFGGSDSRFTLMTEHHLYFTDATHGISVGRNNINNFEEIVVTSDGGATWTVAHYVNPNSDPFQATELRLRDVVRTSGGKYVAVGYRGRILVSTDDGATWTPQVSNTTASLEAISFHDATHGIAAGKNIVVSTNDGGTTWTSKAITYHINNLQAVNATQWLATTAEGSIIRTQDGGNTWVELAGPVGPFNDMKFISSQVGFIVSSNTIYKTADGGATFTDAAFANPGPAGATAVSALSETNLYFVTSGGKFLSSLNALTFTATNGFYSPTQGCAGVAIDFTNVGSPANSYHWFVNNVEVAQTYHLNYAFPIDALSEVKLTSSGGSALRTITKSILVKPAPAATALNFFQIDFKPIPDTVEVATLTTGTLRFGVQVLNSSYQLIRNGTPISSEVTYDNNHPGGVEFSVPTVAAGAYQYNVKSKATNDCGTATRDNLFSMVALGVPERPKNVELFHLTGNGVLVRWSETSKQVTHYNIERREEGTSTWAVVGTVAFDAPTPTRSFTDPALTPLKHYFYRVVAVNGVGSSRYSDIKGISIFSQVIYVNKLATGSNRGTSWANAFTDFDLAAKNSVGDLEIWVAKGVYPARTEYSWTVSTKGVYGGFVGTETLRAQRNARLNKTTLTADLGVAGVRNDNAPSILTLQAGGVIDGFALVGATQTALTTFGLVDNCVIEDNSTGILMKAGGEVANSIVRKNSFGILREANNFVINSFIYDNDFGIGTNDPPTPVSNLIHSVYFRNRELGQVPSGGNNIAEFIGGVQNFKTLEYLSGGDRVLGTDDDIFHYPEPAFIGAASSLGTLPTTFVSGFSRDFEGNPRAVGQVDIGPIEYGPDPWPLPPVATIAGATDNSVTLQWPTVTDATVTRIWIVATPPTGTQSIYPVAKEATSFMVDQLAFNTNYTFELRFEHDRFMSLPGNSVQASTTKKQQAPVGFNDVNVAFSVNPVVLPSTSNGGRSITYSVANTSIATVSGNNVTLKKVGATTITATVAEDSEYFGFSITKSLTITKGTQTLTGLTDRTFNLSVGGSNTITLPANSSVLLPVTYTSANTSVATVSGNTLTVLGAGTSVISASQAGDDNYNSAAGQFTLTVAITKVPQTLSGLSDLVKNLGDADFAPSITASSGLAVTLTSSNTSVATVVGSSIHLMAAGQTTISVSQAGNAFYLPVTGQFFLTVNDAADNRQSQTLTGLNNISKNVGDADFTPSVSASSGLTVTFTSSNTSVATTSGNSIHLVAAGQVTITALQSGNASFKPVSGTFVLTVIDGADNRLTQILTFPATVKKSTAWGSFNLPLTVSSGLVATLSSSNNSIATVSGYSINLLAPGTVTISIQQGGNATYKPVSGQLELTVVGDVNVLNMPNPLSNFRYGMAPVVLEAWTTEGVEITYSSSNTSIIEIDPVQPKMLLQGVGPVTITGTSPATDVFPALTKSVVLTVQKGIPAIQGLQDKTVTYGDAPYELNVSNSAGLPMLVSAIGGLQINGSKVEIVQAGAGTVTVLINESDLFQGTAAISNVTILKAAEAINFAPIADQAIGAKVNLEARTVKTNSATLFSLSSTRASLNGNVLTTVEPGKMTVTAFYVSTVNYLEPTPVQRTFCIIPPSPTVTANGSKLVSSSPSTKWYRNNVVLSETLSQEITATDDGSYTGRVVIDGCPSEPSAPLVVTGLEGSLYADVTISPNPTTDRVFVFGSPKNSLVRLTNMLGQPMPVPVMSSSDGVVEVSLGGLAPGFYLISVEGQSRVHKILKR